MAHLLDSSRRLILGAAFVGVMAGTGAFVGAIGGAILLLLVRTVLGLAADVIAFIPVSIVVGGTAAMALGIVLAVHPSPRLALGTGPTVSVHSESQ